jgi:hypothetical protein
MATDNTLTNGVTTSRLLTSTSQLRDRLTSRNLYTPNSEYEINEESAVSTVNKLIGIVTPFKSFNLENTVVGRMINNPSPLSSMGLVFLGKQFAYNITSNLQQQLPSINIGNLLDKDDSTNLFTPFTDYRITRKNEVTTFENFINQIVYTTNKNDYPFNSESTNYSYVANTGKAQLSLLANQLNNNLYINGANENLLETYADKKKIKNRDGNIYKHVYYNFDNSYFHPYDDIIIDKNSYPFITVANDEMKLSYTRKQSDNDDNIGEYAPSNEYVYNNLGSSYKNTVNNSDLFKWSSEHANQEFKFDYDTDKLIWGRDGVNKHVDGTLDDLRALTDTSKNSAQINNSLDSSFNIRAGLLEFTKNLVTATNGHKVDITRKAFKNSGENIEGYNGSPLWKSNESKYAKGNGFSDGSEIGHNSSIGIRQHSILDSYGKNFTKAIRFNGNNLYNGNPNSVINSTILPRIHPTETPKDDKNLNVPNNKNLMFTIENLAIKTISNGDSGIIDDENGSPIPLEEVGQFGGRVMWFPPYNIKFNETSNAKFESTVMVGRNEPMYNYQNSERGATLSFTLLMDYPENLNQYNKDNEAHKKSAEFFAFGGDALPEYNIEKLKTRRNEIEIELGNIFKNNKPNIQSIPNVSDKVLYFFFPNDYPTKSDMGNLTGLADELYLKYNYEIDEYCMNSMSLSNGLNKDVFVVKGLKQANPTLRYLDKTALPIGFTQFFNKEIDGDFGHKCTLNQMLSDAFKNNEDNKNYYKIVINGGASYLNHEKKGYNYELSQRRITFFTALVYARLKEICGDWTTEIEVEQNPLGDEASTPLSRTESSQEDVMYSTSVKMERYASFKIVPNGKSMPMDETKLNPKDFELWNKLKLELDDINAKIKLAQNKILYSERKIDDEASLNIGKAVKNHYFSPVFHSQTPEDFHKRLTFLQQCTRQGAAVRYYTKPDENNTSSNVVTAKNSVFGRQPICILRLGDFQFTKVIIENITIDYDEGIWDTNPEGFGVQPMIANITLNMKLLGGQSLSGPVDALQNAVSFNYYANSSFTKSGLYSLPSDVADKQLSYINNVVTTSRNKLIEDYNNKNKK